MKMSPLTQVKSPTDEYAKRFITELNLCRNNPQKYSTKIRSFEQYFDKEILRIPKETAIKTKEGYSCFEEAAMFLDNLDAVTQLAYSEGFSLSARDAMVQLQEYKRMDEISQMKIDVCISKFGEVYGPFAQCCDFGTANPELLVILLLADDGDENRANRLSLLNPSFNIIGFSHGTHEIFGDCSVVMLARHFYSLNEKPSEDSEGEEEDAKEKEIHEEAKHYFYNKLKKEYIRKEKIIEERGVRKKLVKEMRIKNGVLFTDIFKEKYEEEKKEEMKKEEEEEEENKEEEKEEENKEDQ